MRSYYGTASILTGYREAAVIRDWSPSGRLVVKVASNLSLTARLG